MRDIACGSWRYRWMFKIEILKLGGSSLAAEISAEHNRLLRRQHCSSLCSQSEGHEHIANMVSVLGHNLVGFSTRACPPNIRPPHFASKVSYSASPHANTDCQRTREQTRASLGAETNASGSRDERRWDGVQLCLLLRALPVVRTGFTEVGFYQW